MELVKDCGWRENCFISSVRGGRGEGRVSIVVSVVWFSRGFVCKARGGGGG